MHSCCALGQDPCVAAVGANAAVHDTKIDIVLCFLGNTVSPFCALFELRLATKEDPFGYWCTRVRVCFPLALLCYCGHGDLAAGSAQTHPVRAEYAEVAEVYFCYGWKSSFRVIFFLIRKPQQINIFPRNKWINVSTITFPIQGGVMPWNCSMNFLSCWHVPFPEFFMWSYIPSPFLGYALLPLVCSFPAFLFGYWKVTLKQRNTTELDWV